MKILTLVFSIGTGGTERAAVNYAIAYRQAAHDSRVLVAGEGHDRKQELEEAGVETVLLTEAGVDREKVLQSLQRWSPDIIHLHNYGDAYLPFIRLLKAPHTRVVETNVFSRPQYTVGYRQVDLSLQLSRWGYWKYQRWMTGAAWVPRMAVVPYIIMGNRFALPETAAVSAFRAQHGIPADAFVAGRIGQPHPSKWDRRILDIAAATIRPENNIWYFLVGLPANMRAELQRMPAWLQGRIVLLDAIRGDRQLALYYHSLQCMVHLSAIGESFGYVLAEALSCRVPVVTLLTPFRDNAQYEVVGHRLGGFCCTTVQACVEAVQALHDTPSLREEIRSRLPGWVEQRYSPEAVIPHLVEQYCKLSAGESPELPETTSLVKDVCRLYGWKGRLLYPALLIYHHRITYRLLQFIKRRPV